MAKLILEIFSQTLGIIHVGFERRANPTHVLNRDARLLQAKPDSAARKLPAGVFCQRKTLFFCRRNQLSVAKQDRGAVVMTVFDAGANANHIHFFLYLPMVTERGGAPRVNKRPPEGGIG